MVKIICGLEIHQQLDTHKLFCDCPTITTETTPDPDFKVVRMLRASAGESGTVDQAADAEQKKQKTFLYEGSEKTACLVDLDEEPPHRMNEDALRITLQMCLMLKSEIVDNIRVMRKTVIDGSNTSGFQRTALVGLGGTVDGIGIETVCLEEDAAKIISRTSTQDVYDLSRLGIPLIEIATAPEITTPKQAYEVAKKIGMMLRSTGMVKRGIGTIRQDLNISIEKGERVELKGVQELKLIPTYVELEAQRQSTLFEIFEKLKERNASVDETLYDVTAQFKDTKAKVIMGALRKGGDVLAIRMHGFAGFLGKDIQPGRRLGTEYSDYAKSQGVHGLFHSDELPNYGISSTEVTAVRKALQLGKQDAFIMIADQGDLAKKALEQVIWRAKKLSLIKEVRQALPDATSKYLRPMPGAHRMYPETDVPSVTPNTSKIVIPELLEDKEKRYCMAYKISKDLARQLVRDSIAFDEMVSTYKEIEPTTLAKCLVLLPKDLKKRYNVVLPDYENAITQVLDRLNKKEISVQSIIDILLLLAKNKPVPWKKFVQLSDGELDAIIAEEIARDAKAPVGALMGSIMKRCNGRVDGKTVREKLLKVTS